MPKFLSAKVIALIFLAGCSSTSKVTSIESLKKQNPIATDLKIQSENLDNIRLIQLPGNNFLSSVHKSGNRLLFFSSSRISHKKFQVYEYDLKKLSERRVTHQNGHAFHASYHPNNQHIIYASTTDYDKEDLSELFQINEANPEKSWQSMIPELKSDIYISRLNGTNIIRATYMDSGEQYPLYHPKDFTIVYQLSNNESTSIERMSRYRKPLPPLSIRNEKHSFLDISKTGKKLAWIKYDEDKGFFLNTMNWNAKNKQTRELKGVLSISSLNWINDSEIIITARTSDDDVHQVYYIPTDLSCMHKIADSKYGIQNAIASSDNRVYLTAHTGTHWQLVESKIKKAFACPPAKVE